MRHQIFKLEKRTSTKAERRFVELLKKHHIPFMAKVRIAGREVDFLVGTLAIEINGHEQDPIKNATLLDLGYTPLHFNNEDIRNNISIIELTLTHHVKNSTNQAIRTPGFKA